ncbi:hypothetical protein ACIQZG_01220 [Lysinibacillus sp. NPDC096418]|uniref:hypothetical protein n=1 Tax=Lysinibacillus sp. NPDC096418 TaxID=3364138 RepID=UPI0037F2955E
MLKARVKDEKQLIIQKIKQINKSFQKPLLKIIEYENEKMGNFYRKNSTHTKKWISVESSIIQVIRFYGWLMERYSLSSWAEVEEDMVNKYLLEFDFVNGQNKKRTLYNFFAYMKKHGFIFTVPIEQFVARDDMIEVKPLSITQHKEIFRSIEYGDEDLVTERFITSLIYFHGLTSAQIRSIELENIFLEKKYITIENRPPAYLSEIDLLLLEKALKIRESSLKRKQSKKLFPSYKSLKDVSISNILICKKVKSITGFTPKYLRIAAFQYCAARFGPQFLNECFGLSLTQSARYGRIGEELVGLQVNEEIKTN